MPNKRMTPNPKGCRLLTDPEVSRLRERHQGLWSDPKRTCLTCCKEETGSATFRTWVGTEIVTYDCQCTEQWSLHRWLLNSGIDTSYQRYSWDHVDTVSEAAQTAVLKYMDHASAMINRGIGMTLWSPDRGTGKSLLGSLLIKGLMAQGHDAHFTQFNEMIAHHVAGWRNEEERKWFIKRVRNVGILLVDDMGRESKGRENVTEAMFDEVIRARVAAALPTIITTNFTPAQLLQGYGHNVMSLLSEVNSEVEVPGVDYRPRSKAALLRDAIDGITYPFVVS